MNRILFEAAEISGDAVSLAPDDARAIHIRDVLKAADGKILKTGVVSGNIGSGLVEHIGTDGVRLRVRHDQAPPAPWIDLILAPPRPRAFKRLLGQLVQMGVGRIYLVGAEKVEKMFWGATILKEEEYRPLMVEALMQCGSTILPEIEIHRNFRKFLASLPAPSPEERRIVAHPATGAEANILYHSLAGAQKRLLAIGPEGGWTPAELEALEKLSFMRFSLTERILRTDTAAIAILGALAAVESSAPAMRR